MLAQLTEATIFVGSENSASFEKYRVSLADWSEEKNNVDCDINVITVLHMLMYYKNVNLNNSATRCVTVTPLFE